MFSHLINNDKTELYCFGSATACFITHHTTLKGYA